MHRLPLRAPPKNRSQSSSPRRRSERPVRVVERHEWACDSRRTLRERALVPPRTILGRPLARPRIENTARGAQRDRLCTRERAETHTSSASCRNRSVLFGNLVRRLVRTSSPRHEVRCLPRWRGRHARPQRVGVGIPPGAPRSARPAPKRPIPLGHVGTRLTFAFWRRATAVCPGRFMRLPPRLRHETRSRVHRVSSGLRAHGQKS